MLVTHQSVNVNKRKYKIISKLFVKNGERCKSFNVNLTCCVKHFCCGARYDNERAR
jgi:hypothetical protein